MQREKGSVKKIIFIIFAILVIVFLVQQAYLRGFGKTFISNATDQIKGFMAKGADWASSTVYPKISGEVQKRGDIINKEVNQEKQKVSESIGQKISNYFSGIGDSILHPGTAQNCQPVQPAQTSSGSGN